MAPRRSRRPQEIFLSHASADRVFADAIAGTLRGHGLPVWYSTTNIQGAQQWHDEIGHALTRCNWFVVVLSPSAVGSRWVKHELLYALNNARYEKRIVPLLSRACDWKRLSWTLGALQIVDFRGSFDAACRNLLTVWGLGFDAARAARPRKRIPVARRRRAVTPRR